jgi:hypothetical protein
MVHVRVIPHVIHMCPLRTIHICEKGIHFLVHVAKACAL